MRVAFYLRTSHRERTTENQRLQLSKAAKSRGWTDVTIFEDKAISGSKASHDRPALNDMLKQVFAGEFDAVASVALDRLGRSAVDVLSTVEEIDQAGSKLVLLREGLDTSTPTGRAMLTMMAAFAQLERDLIKERINAGLDRARKQGKRLGRPPVDTATRDKVVELARTGPQRAPDGEAGRGQHRVRQPYQTTRSRLKAG